MEVLKRRNKYGRPCDKNWKNYDDTVMAKHTNSIGCRAPYHTLSNNITICTTKEQMKKVLVSIDSNAASAKPPCKGMENLYYTHEESDMAGTKFEIKGQFWVGIFVYITQFKEIVQSR